VTNQDYLHIHTVVTEKTIFDSITAAMEDAANELVEPLRQSVRQGEMLKAARIEAEIKTLEELPETLARYSAKYRTSK
jgi:hypothetical protein